MTLRTYRDADLEPVARLFTDSVHAVAAGHYDAAQRAAWAPQPPDLEAWRRRLGALHTLVASDGGVLAGVIAYEANGHIDLLYTAPAYARRGVASALYRHVESTLAAAGIGAVFTEASLVARPFFERHGFTTVEEQRVERRGIFLQRYAMRKTISEVRV